MLWVFAVTGEAEGSVPREEWHGRVTALSVAPEFRRLGLAAKLMELLEGISEKKGGFFVDLFVRVSNQVAVNMYKQLGYSVYRAVLEYYSASSGEPDEDAYACHFLSVQLSFMQRRIPIDNIAAERDEGHQTIRACPEEGHQDGERSRGQDLRGARRAGYEKSSFQRYGEEIDYTSASSCETRRF
ncbi:N-alpha-acetyltransferase 20 [Gymnogyps californianus]|uniref:N-alpha-acetyltransferase 20 n=1 Tax=Gymnogyps californianus TaxID=33616 RepID=UPI0021C6C031|nr:N-alpha-acetyltransferase 20 [Gymnogyps californianus]